MPKAKKIKSISKRLVVSWDERFEQLKGYKKDHGDCNVPRNYMANPQLANWVNTNRTKYKNRKLSKERIERLQGIGFNWNPEDDRWNEMFGQLMVYNDEHKHCNVPRGYKDNPQLANWVMKQRTVYKNGKLLPDRIKLLKEVGFSWAPRVGWDEGIQTDEWKLQCFTI